MGFSKSGAKVAFSFDYAKFMPASFGEKQKMMYFYTSKMNENEKRVVGNMIAIYCRAHHNISSKGLCEACAELRDYSMQQLEYCPYGEQKPPCSRCPIHCYKKERRLQIREVMRFSGRRMIFKHPIDAIWHLYREKMRK